MLHTVFVGDLPCAFCLGPANMHPAKYWRWLLLSALSVIGDKLERGKVWVYGDNAYCTRNMVSFCYEYGISASISATNDKLREHLQYKGKRVGRLHRSGDGAGNPVKVQRMKSDRWPRAAFLEVQERPVGQFGQLPLLEIERYILLLTIAAPTAPLSSIAAMPGRRVWKISSSRS